MTELLDREKKPEGTLSEVTEAAPRPVRVSRTWALLAAVILATGLGVFAYNAANGADDSVAQAAEARAEAMVEVYESRWLSDPANIAALRAQDMVEHYENLWRLQSGQ